MVNHFYLCFVFIFSGNQQNANHIITQTHTQTQTDKKKISETLYRSKKNRSSIFFSSRFKLKY